MRCGRHVDVYGVEQATTDRRVGVFARFFLAQTCDFMHAHGLACIKTNRRHMYC
jgi:hypothetical protein